MCENITETQKRTLKILREQRKIAKKNKGSSSIIKIYNNSISKIHSSINKIIKKDII